MFVFSPHTVIVPSEGVSSPASMFASVDFPLPDCPIRAVIFLAGMFRLMFLSAVLFPFLLLYILVRFLISMALVHLLRLICLSVAPLVHIVCVIFSPFGVRGLLLFVCELLFVRVKKRVFLLFGIVLCFVWNWFALSRFLVCSCFAFAMRLFRLLFGLLFIVSMIVPFCRMAIFCATDAAMTMLCVMRIRDVLFCWQSCCSILIMSVWFVSSRFEVGSSAMMSLGLFAIASAIATRCASPPDSWCG